MYDYNHYNSPEKGNKNIYAYGEKHSTIEHCGFIHADNRVQAQAVLNAHNKAWNDFDSILLDEYSVEMCRREYKRRAAEYNRKEEVRV